MAHHVARHCGAPLSHLSDLADVQPAEVPERRERVLVGDRYLVDILSSGRCGRGARTRELLHRRLKQRCSGGGTPKQPTHHFDPSWFEEYMYTIQGVRRAEAMGRSQMPSLFG
jgi:hypothetical protein